MAVKKTIKEIHGGYQTFFKVIWLAPLNPGYWDRPYK